MDLHVIWNDTLTSQRHADEILKPKVDVVPYAAAIGYSFLLMHDNSSPHTVRRVVNMLEMETIQRMAWLTCSIDLNTIDDV